MSKWKHFCFHLCIVPSSLHFPLWQTIIYNYYEKEDYIMAVRNAGASIREARLKAGLSQEQLSDGICSPLSLSRIENGAAGVSPSTFQALMAHAGAPCEIFPIFANQKDFECFYALKHARFHLDSWQLQPAYEELDKIEEMHWADNKFYYQEWLLLHCKLQFRSGLTNHQEVYSLLLDALHVTRPDFLLNDFRNLLLSLNEIQILILLAQESLYLNQSTDCLLICTQLDSYLNNSQITYLEKEHLMAENTIVYVKYLLSIFDYDKAATLANEYRHQMVLNAEDGPIFELTFLTGLSIYYLNNTEDALSMIQDAFYSAYSIESSYATTIREYAKKHLKLSFPDYFYSLPDINLLSYPQKKAIDTAFLKEGIYDLFSPDIFTIGTIIQHFRTEQKVSQSVLCQGLCSKSKLSKIENGTLQPDIFLAETLLQRLGISEREFTFWGDVRESNLYELRYKLNRMKYLSKDEKKKLLESFKTYMPCNNPILEQIYFLYSIIVIDNPEEKLDVLLQGLHCTLPDFDINQIHKYRLSWAELSLLNNIAYTYQYKDTEISYLYFNKILDYFHMNSPDILLEINIIGLTLFRYCHSLYNNKHYHQLCTLSLNRYMPLVKYKLSNYSFFLFYYSQALGECSDFSNAQKYGHFSYHLQKLIELYVNASDLQKYLLEDFSIILS